MNDLEEKSSNKEDITNWAWCPQFSCMDRYDHILDENGFWVCTNCLQINTRIKIILKGDQK